MKATLKRYKIIQWLLPCFRMLRIRMWMIRSQNRLYEILKRQTEIWIELGSGAKSGKGKWVTLDINGQCDLYCNLLTGLPFPDESVTRIHSSHFFEHLTPHQAKACMKDCLRVLKKNGEFSIAVPNGRLYIDAYFNGLLNDRPVKVSTPIDFIRMTAYCDGYHHNIFDQDALCDMLKSAGLMHVEKRDFDSSMDVEARKWETIFAKGVKP